MYRRGLFSGVLALIAAVCVIDGSAQQRAASFPVIVVFHDDAPFEQFGAQYRQDDRARSAPAAWDYLDHGVVGAVRALEAREGFRADHVYSAAVRGFAARLTARQIDVLERNPMVDYVEADGVVTITGQTLPWGINRVDADISSTRAGDGRGVVGNVNVYVIDTGIDLTHRDLNVVEHVNVSGDTLNADCHGHGTHVSGTIAAIDNTVDVVGVAPGAPLHGVKVLSCGGSGSTSNVIKGVDWVTRHAVLPAIANMSLGGGMNKTLDRAVIRSADRGIFYSVAAGNNGLDACNTSPARTGVHDGVMTTAATDSTDHEARWSNFGSCVDVWAPGVSIVSTRMGGGTVLLSGTSMASPHVGGVGALFLSGASRSTAAEVEARLKADAAATNATSRDGREVSLVSARSY